MAAIEQKQTAEGGRFTSVLKKCLAAEGKALSDLWKRIDTEDAPDHLVEKLIPGVIIGAASTAIAVGALKADSATEYLVSNAQAIGSAVNTFAMDNSMALVAGGSLVAGAGVLVFLKGLKLENDELRKRYADAFEKSGYGPESVAAATRAHRQILKTHESITNALATERENIKALLSSPSKEMVRVANRTFGFDLKDPEERHHLYMAYMHGLTNAMAVGVEKGRPMGGQILHHSKYTAEAVVEGMTQYYQSLVGNEPGFADKAKYILTGRLTDLQRNGLARKISEKGYDFIRQYDDRVPKQNLSKEEVLAALKAREGKRHASDNSLDI
ncbi:hypothetical protein ACYPKM_03615 [Pseudomonas aeruginosa]